LAVDILHYTNTNSNPSTDNSTAANPQTNNHPKSCLRLLSWKL
jgi:hypothetical protein